MSEIKYPTHWYKGGDMSNFHNHEYSNGGHCVMTSWQFKTWRNATNFKLSLDSALKLQQSVKERIKIIQANIAGAEKNGETILLHECRLNLSFLQSLVEESEKT